MVVLGRHLGTEGQTVDISAEDVKQGIGIAERVLDVWDRISGKDASSSVQPADTGTTAGSTNSTDYTPWIVGGVLALTAVAAGAVFMSRRRK